MGRSLDITLLRHGLTSANTAGQYNGWLDLSLSMEGLKSVQSLRNMMPQMDGVFSSDLRRAVETSKELFPQRTPVHFLPSLREVHFGDWEGKTFGQLREEPSFVRWLEDPNQFHPTNGESFEKFRNRVLAGWEEVLDQCYMNEYKKVAVVSHGGVIRLLLHELEMQRESFWSRNVTFGIGYVIKGSLRREGGFRCISLQEELFMERING